MRFLRVKKNFIKYNFLNHLKNDKGAAAVEFAFLGPSFIILLFGILYIGINYWSAAQFDKNLELIVNDVYMDKPVCGTYSSGNRKAYTAACLKTAFCAKSTFVFGGSGYCASKASFDLRVLAGNGGDTIPDMFDAGSLNSAAFGSSSGAVKGQLVLIRAAMPFQFIFPASFFGGSKDGYLNSSYIIRIRNNKAYTNVS